MRPLFPPGSNSVFRLVLVGAALSVVTLVAAPMIYVRSPLHTDENHVVAQPIDFDHRHHVRDDGIDCRFCHFSVETSPSAGLPATDVCLGCHAQIWNKSPLLAPLRRSFFTGEPLHWKRVSRVPDFVYFDHAIHVAKGVGCETCHGRVDQMPAIAQKAPLTMGWCLDCHRDPAPNLRPRSAITAMGWKPEGDPRRLGEALMTAYHVHTRTSCTACHR